jgi:chromosome segregation ATPase
MSFIENWFDHTLSYLQTKPAKKEIGVKEIGVQSNLDDCKTLLKNLELKKNLEIQQLLKEINKQNYQKNDMNLYIEKKQQEIDELESELEDLQDKYEDLSNEYKKIDQKYKDLYQSFHRKSTTRS